MPNVSARAWCLDLHRLLAGKYTIELGAKRLGDSSSLETTLVLTGEDKILFDLSKARAHAH